jgi:hypothetical protein
MGLFANQALAATWDPGNGFIEVCKNSVGTPAVTGSFAFKITDSQANVTNVVVPVGLCSAPLPVKAGAATVTELGSLTGLTNGGALDTAPHREFVKIASVSAVGPSGPITPGTGLDPWSYTVNVPVSATNAGTVTITFNDQLVQGYIEVCKAIVAGSGLTGTWAFTITGANGYSLVQSVPAAACSDPILLPAGVVKVQETGDLAENVTAITATQGASPPVDVTVGPDAGPKADLPTATTVAKVTAATDPSNQTLITFTNDSVRLKVCKYIDAGLTNIGPYTFNFTATGPSGPNTAPGPLTMAAGTAAAPNCQVVGTFRAGVQVGITEAVVPGTKVGSIVVNPSAATVTGSLSLPNRTVTVTLGAGETVVTYEDIPALNGALKLCKTAGSPAPIGSTFAFTVSAAGTATQTATVPVGSCVTLPLTFLFNATVTIVETPSTGNAVTSITATPAFVTVLEGGVATATSQAVLSSANIGTGTATVLIGENNTTEVTYINHDPPSDTGGGTTGGSTGGTTTGGSTGGSTTSSSSGGSSSGGSSSSSSSTPATTSVPALTTVPTSVGVGVAVGTSSTTSATAAAKAAILKAQAAKLAKLNKQLAKDKTTLKTLVAKHAAAKTLVVKHRLAKQITALKLSEAKLVKQIKQLKS